MIIVATVIVIVVSNVLVRLVVLALPVVPNFFKNTIICIDFGNAPYRLAPHCDKFVLASYYAAILGYEMCSHSPAGLGCPALWSKQLRPGYLKDMVYHSTESILEGNSGVANRIWTIFVVLLFIVITANMASIYT